MLGCVVAAAVAAIYPRAVLTVHAPGQRLWTTLSRRPRRREAIIGRLIDTVRDYQSHHAPEP